MDSRKPVYEEILQAIQDERSNVIGVVGVEDVKLRDIQSQIADHLSFSLMEETELGRALRLSHRLKTEKILIILDGVWEKLDLEAIGIPLNENEKKRLETSESIDVQEGLTSTYECNELEEIICLDWKDAGQQLRYLYAPSQPVFPKLRKILIKGCIKLRKSSSQACFFPQIVDVSSLSELTQLSICNCNNLEVIISSDSEETQKHRNVNAPFPQFFPKLWRISIEKCKKLKTFFSATTVTSLPTLQQLIVKDCNTWEEIISLDSVQAGQFRNLHPLYNHEDCFPKLGSVQIESCNSLKTIFMEIVSTLPELLELTDCNEWEEIISLDSVEESELRDHICFPSLRKIEIEGCNRLKAIFSSTTARRLPMLEKLFVKDCSKLEDIISLDSKEARQCTNQLTPFL
ncbi:hypothetical protein V8G54_033207 [Vigna mungo]|uniref:Uncharacterized protein n=1 Tax=Vigna mungo TaxID=3915 RepID=A0AAQ3MMJ1_VIGMU